ncbi:MAG: GGDEF domain-containing protein [Candidatus Marsarchaeota archaeon]|jgi:diguanylate cyclase (GGDEF)-like protein|nr:GGDEF domain-containing protein [Candidatus Marsarchaeota archaeon]
MTTKRHDHDNGEKITEQTPRPTNMHGAHARQPMSVERHTIQFLKDKNADLEAKVKKLENDKHELIKALAVASRISLENDELKKKNEALERFTLDGLTGLGRVELFNNKGFPEAFGNAMRYDLNLAIIIIDLNDLKKTNDIDSYEAGNRLLRKTAEVIKETTRVNDSKYKLEAGYRWGGDEFIIIANIPDGNSKEVDSSAKSILRRLEDALVANGVNCSIGACVMAPKRSMPVDEDKGSRITYMEKPTVEHEIKLSRGDVGMIRDAMFKSAEKEMKKDKSHKKGKHISTLKRE